MEHLECEDAYMNGHARRVLTLAQVASACELMDCGGLTINFNSRKVGRAPFHALSGAQTRRG